MYFLIYKNKSMKDFTNFTNEVFQTEKEALEYGKRNKFKKSTDWKAIEYTRANVSKYWYK
tara:strand:- start:370 stop:549 length:180 start_codon:yes stop_codon:yes gene_type:complete